MELGMVWRTGLSTELKVILVIIVAIYLYYRYTKSIKNKKINKKDKLVKRDMFENITL